MGGGVGELVGERGDAALEALLSKKEPAPPADRRPLPDWAEVHKELRRPGVTLMLLWVECRVAHPDGYAYSQFARHYRSWRGHLDLVMRQDHRAGGKCFVDFPGQRLPIYDARTGEVAFQAELFVAVLGASSGPRSSLWPSPIGSASHRGGGRSDRVGKTYLACALGNAAIRHGHSALYLRGPRLHDEIVLARAEGRLARLLAPDQAADVLEVIEDRVGLRSTIVTSQLPVAVWHDALTEPNRSHGILDRLLEHVHRIELRGESLRRKADPPTDSSDNLRRRS